MAAACSRPASGVSSSASTTWVSGSPNRALNSTTRGPAAVIARPTYSRPANGVPRRRISARVGSTPCRARRRPARRRPGQRGVRAHAAGVRTGVAVADALEVLCGKQREDVTPSVTQKSDTSGPSRYSSMTTRGTRPHGPGGVGSSVTTTPLPAARPSSLTTYGGPNASRAASTSSAVAQMRAPAVGTPAAAMISLANALEPSSRAAARPGRTRVPAARTASATPATSGTSGPTRPGRPHVGGEGRHRGPVPTASGRCSATTAVPALPGAQTSAVTAGSAAEGQAHRVLPRAAAHHQHPHPPTSLPRRAAMAAEGSGAAFGRLL